MVRKGSPNKDGALHAEAKQAAAVLDPKFTKWLDGGTRKLEDKGSGKITTIQIDKDTAEELKKLRGKQQVTYDVETYDMIIRRLIESYIEKKKKSV